MPTVHVTKGNDNKLCGISERDQKAYAKFIKRVQELTPRDSVVFTWKEPRSGPFHRRHFAMIHALFDAQEQFDDQDQFRKWLEIGAGYADMVPGPTGRMCAMPKSIAYERLDQAEFEPIHEAVFRFARTVYATRFLWPHLTDEQGAEMVLTLLREFE